MTHFIFVPLKIIFVQQEEFEKRKENCIFYFLSPTHNINFSAIFLEPRVHLSNRVG